MDLLKMLAEILGIPQAVEFEETEYAGTMFERPTPTSRSWAEVRPPMHVDLGRGLLQLIAEVRTHRIRMDRVAKCHDSTACFLPDCSPGSGAMHAAVRGILSLRFNKTGRRFMPAYPLKIVGGGENICRQFPVDGP